MDRTNRRADYDLIAQTYDKRYERNPYAGVEAALRQFIGDEAGLHILEVGCGTGHWLDTLQEPGRYLAGLDLSAGMLAKARRHVFSQVPLVRGDAGHLPFPDHSFDRIFCINALHHFPDKAAFLRDVWRVLRPPGTLLSVGLDPHQGLDQWHVYEYFPESLAIDRQRYPSTDILPAWMSTAGFEDCQTREVEHWSVQLPAREIFAQGRLEKAATSQLSVLTDAEYHQGIQRIQADMESAEAEGRTLFLTMDLRLYGTTGTAR